MSCSNLILNAHNKSISKSEITVSIRNPACERNILWKTWLYLAITTSNLMQTQSILELDIEVVLIERVQCSLDGQIFLQLHYHLSIIIIIILSHILHVGLFLDHYRLCCEIYICWNISEIIYATNYFYHRKFCRLLCTVTKVKNS